MTSNNLHAPFWGWRKEPWIYYVPLFYGKVIIMLVLEVLTGP